MGNQTKSRKPKKMGNGQVTPVQIAFIVDRYLADNDYRNTRSVFRNEASDLISRSPVHEAPRSLMSLGEILKEYVSLKEQKLMFDQEKSFLEQEKFRVQTLLKGMQDVMNSYNNGNVVAATVPPLPFGVANSAALVTHIDQTTGSPADFPVYKTPVVMQAARPLCAPPASINGAAPTKHLPTTKRKKSCNPISNAPVTVKRSRNQSTSRIPHVQDTNTLAQQSNVLNSHLRNSLTKESSVQGSSVVKCLFNQPTLLPPTKSFDPNTPPQEAWSPTNNNDVTNATYVTNAVCTNDVTNAVCTNDVLHTEFTNASCTNDVTPQQPTSISCSVITTGIAVSPTKQMAIYSIERNCCVSSTSPIKTNMKSVSKRDHVKGKLDFDDSDIARNSACPIIDEVSAPENEKEVNCIDFDIDTFGEDFNFSELLGELDNFIETSPSLLSGLSHTSENAISGANQVLSELSSTVTEVLTEKNMNLQGPDSVTAVKSITKSLKILSPVKNQKSLYHDQENYTTCI